MSKYLFINGKSFYVEDALKKKDVGIAILSAVAPHYSYVDGVRSNEPDGFTYSGYLERLYCSLNVVVSQSQPIVTEEQLAKAMLSDTPIRVKFEGLQCKIYKTKDMAGEKFTADSVSIVKPKKGEE